MLTQLSHKTFHIRLEFFSFMRGLVCPIFHFMKLESLIACRGCVIQIYVERISGCPHMECRMCASEFCYYCGDRWDDEHLLSCVKAVDEDGRRPVLDLDEIREFRMARRRQRGRRIRKKLKRGGIIGRTLLFFFIF